MTLGQSRTLNIAAKECQLLPCPFCGGEEFLLHVTEWDNIRVKLRQVECKRCGAAGPPHLDVGREDQVAEFWNGRYNEG
jgi:Lar family restriction alleviation protein